MAVSTTQVGNLSITTQVIPAGESNVPGLATLSSTQNWTQVLAQKKKQPVKSLSAVIILIGALQLCVGVSMSVAENDHLSLLSRCRIYLLGIVFISSGIFTVIFASEESIVKIKTILISHVISATSAAIGMILYTIQIYTDSQACWAPLDSHGSNPCFPSNSSATRSPYFYRYDYVGLRYSTYVYTLRVSLNSLVLFYIFVGFVISICIMLLRWKALKKAKYSLLGN